MENHKYVNQKEIDDKQNIEDKKQDKIDKKQNKTDSKISKAQKLEGKQLKIQNKLQERENKLKSNIENESTEIIGKSKRALLTKINKYKKNELSDYKIKKGASEIELQEHITNIQDLLDNNEVDCYITEAIYQSIKMIEPFSTNTRYKINGLSAMLKLNP